MDVAVPRSVVDRPSADRLLMTSKDLADRNCSRDTKKVLVLGDEVSSEEDCLSAGSCKWYKGSDRTGGRLTGCTRRDYCR